jgi:hypothetical protein
MFHESIRQARWLSHVSDSAGTLQPLSNRQEDDMSKKYTAQCACGACKFEFGTDPTFIANCHCLDCKKASGGEMATFFAVPESDFTLLGGKPKAFPYVSEAGKKLERNFCPECGARLFTNNLESFPGMVFVTLGSLDRPELVRPLLEMFTKRRLPWAKPLDLPQFPSMPS